MDNVIVGEGHILHTDRSKKAIRTILDITQARYVFEIGFNAGHSAKLFLNQGVNVKSIDIGYHPYTVDCARKLYQQHPRQFKFEQADSRQIGSEELEGFDLVFIDGNHHDDGLLNDLELALEAGNRWILVDDCMPDDKWWPNIYPLVMKFVDNNPYKLVASMFYDAGANGSIEQTAMMLLEKIDE